MLFRKTIPGVAICPFFQWTSENIEGAGHTENDVNLTLCTHVKNRHPDIEGNCDPEMCPFV